MKILTLDIETTPNLGHIWGLWNQNIGLSQLLESGSIFAFAAKWYGDKDVHFYSDYHTGHDEMVRAAHGLLNEADVVVHYNGTKFDMKWLRTAFKQAGLPRHKPVQEIDLLRVVRKEFYLPSYKLQYVANSFLGLGSKTPHTGHDLWIKTMAGDPKAWALMRKYNIQDVKLTERVYDELKPWIRNHPNPALYSEDGVRRCICGSTRVQKRGFYYTEQSKFQQYACMKCGKWRRDTKALDRVTERGVA